MPKNLHSSNKKNLRAFSLIELSVVLVILGLLVTGATQGTTLIAKARIMGARMKTRSSPVQSIPDLALWYEAVSENSFASGATMPLNKANPDEGEAIARWNDISLLSGTENHATQLTASSQPIYRLKGISNLPALEFDGANDFFSYDGTFLVGSDYTIFVVEMRTSSKFGNYFMCGTLPVTYNNLHFGYRQNNLVTLDHYYSIFDVVVDGFSSPIPDIYSFFFNKNNGKVIFRNGRNIGSSTLNVDKQPLISYPGSMLGCGGTYRGLLGEIIIFARALEDNERQQVETYLSSKWKIGLQ